MPNDCWNTITITCNSIEELNNFVSNELQNKEKQYNENIVMMKRRENGIKFSQTTAWNPDYVWLESLVSKYPNVWIKNEWYEEGGFAGVWIGSKKGMKFMEWEDLSIDAKYEIFDKLFV